MDGGALHFGGVVIPVCAGPSPRVGGTTDEPRTIRTSGTADELGTRGYAERIPPEMPCVRCASASGRRLQSTGQRKEREHPARRMLKEKGHPEKRRKVTQGLSGE